MKRKDLEKKLGELEKKYRYYKDSHTEMFNLQYETSKLFMEIIHDFNEKTGRYNFIIASLTVVIAFLTLVMVIKMFI